MNGSGGPSNKGGGGLKKTFFQLFGSQFGLEIIEIRGGGRVPRASPLDPPLGGFQTRSVSPRVLEGIRIPESEKILTCRIRNSGKFCSWNPESWALESRIQLKGSGILLTIGIQNPSFTGIRNPWNAIQNLRLSWIPYMGRPATKLRPLLNTKINTKYVK